MLDVLRPEESLLELFVKKEEHEPRELDGHGRFLFGHSKHKDVLTPSVSKFLIEKGSEPDYPGGKKFAVCLTHAVDVVNPWFMVLFLTLGRRRRWIMKWLDRILNPGCNLGDIMDPESRFDVKSTFFFLALSRGEKSFNCYVEDMDDEINSITSRGWSVGLHGGYEAFNDLPLLQKQKEALERVTSSTVSGYPNHYLGFSPPTSWEILEKVGFAYDTTFGYPDHVGFRSGMCHPFRPFNDTTSKSREILEIPLAIMDVILLNSMNLSAEKSTKLIRELVDCALECRGVLTINWHNSQLTGGNPRRIYENMLEYSGTKGEWLTSSDEICNSWIKNNFMRDGG
jgi:peptidoglycan/xylan/chitin deacetylase (PgdA/CDA1 family)